MNIKLQINKPINECHSFLSILIDKKLSFVYLFEGSEKFIQLYNTNSETRRELYNCCDVAELIIDRNINNPV